MLTRTLSQAPHSRSSVPMSELEPRHNRLQLVSSRLSLSGQLHRCGVRSYRCCLPRLLANYPLLSPGQPKQRESGSSGTCPLGITHDVTQNSRRIIMLLHNPR